MSVIAQIAIVGGGVAGLTLAAELHAAGRTVRVFEAAPEIGGRCATLRNAAGSFDHGAPSFTAASGRFRPQVQGWQDAAWIEATGDAHFIARPTMAELPARLAQGVDVSCGAAVAALIRASERWQLRLADGRELGGFDAVLLALPPRQAVPLLQADPALAERLRSVVSEPMWTVSAAWPAALPTSQDRVPGPDPLGPLGQALRMDRRPGRTRVGGIACRWVLQATPAWSAHNLDVPPGQVTQHLLGAFSRALGVSLARPVHASAQLWREARVPQPLAEPCAWHAELRLGACGDAWSAREGAEGVERAWLSAQALAACV